LRFVYSCESRYTVLLAIYFLREDHTCSGFHTYTSTYSSAYHHVSLICTVYILGYQKLLSDADAGILGELYVDGSDQTLGAGLQFSTFLILPLLSAPLCITAPQIRRTHRYTASLLRARYKQ